MPPPKPQPIPLHRTPAAGFEQPFEMLAACHERVERMLSLLERLAEHLPDHGCDAQAQDAARDVMRYFDVAAPAHHEDEERHVLPVLREQGEDAFAAQLEQEHREMARRWLVARRALAGVVAGRWNPSEAGEVFACWRSYAALYRAHAEAEDQSAFPLARARLDAEAQKAMGQEMAARRGVK